MEENRIEGAAAALAAHSKDAAGGPTSAPHATPEQPHDDAATPQDGMRAAAAAIADTARKVGTGASEIGGQAYERAAQAGEYLGRTAKEQPLAFVLAGMAFGYVLGFLIHRQRG
jgi:hypothetical protein